MSIVKTIKDGVITSNPVLVLLIGLCPVLATTTSVKNALGMGLATMFVLTMSNIVISLFAKFFPKKIRIPCFIVVIAGFVTITKMLMDAYAPTEINEGLGIFIPLIVVNCIILGRAEAFASKNGVLASFFDGIGTGLGFVVALVLLAFFRELLGAGAIFDMPIYAELKPITLFILSPGAFLVLGMILGFIAWRKHVKTSRQMAQREAEIASASVLTSKSLKQS